MNSQKCIGKKIIIADDDPAIVESVQYILEEAGFKVETTLDGNRVQKMADSNPDLLILDIWMSGSDGRQICRSLKSQDKTKDIPVILFSANNETEKLSRQAGADDFLAKPFEITELLEKVENHIN